MAHNFLDLLRGYLVSYGYWAVAAALLLENAGLPIPGETVLLLASFLAYSQHELRLPYVILVGVCAATLGDNLGYALGHYGGRPLLERYGSFFRVPHRVIPRGERLFERYGPAAILFARFVFGMRVIAGPLAGVLRMHWKKFAICNLLGATLWVTVIAGAGYLFGRHWRLLMRYIGDANLAISIAVILIVAFIWWRRRREAEEDSTSDKGE
jgi:membrane protein DedA with SNARE-associated domain